MVRLTCSSWVRVSRRGENTSFATSKIGGENTCFIMGCGSPFGGFVSPFVGFVGFLHLGLLYFFCRNLSGQWLLVDLVMGSQ